MMENFENPNHELNSDKYHTGEKCIDCDNPAGTAWSPLWCFECNVKRMRRIDERFKNLEKMLTKGIDHA